MLAKNFCGLGSNGVRALKFCNGTRRKRIEDRSETKETDGEGWKERREERREQRSKERRK